MSLKNTQDSFGSVSKLLHWLIALLVIVMVIAGWFMDGLPDSIRGTVVNLHKLTGLSILFLMIFRLFWVLINPKPVSPPGTSAIQHLIEWVGHAFLYFLIIAMPLSGWIGSAAAGRAPYLGDFLFNLPITQSKQLVKLSFEIHEILAILIIVTVSLHILAALYHHYVCKDNVLKRMMPSR